MKTIYRYSINEVSGVNDIKMPSDAVVITTGVAEENGKEVISLWALVDTDSANDATRRFCVFGTGADMNDLDNFDAQYIGTVQKANKYAFHVFEVIL